ncbi:MAG: hypothetical protein CL885_02815 [Dehalococcoidia bacterium]|nr:hypothetical protein [Dehalococcoidia bacterium]
MNAQIFKEPFHPFNGQSFIDTIKIRKISDVIKHLEPGFACGAHNSVGSGVVHLRPMNIDIHGELSLTQVRRVNPEFNQKRLKKFDVLFNNTNSPELVGKTTLIRKIDQEFAFSNHMTRIEFDESLVFPAFAAIQLHYLFQSRYFRHRCTNHVSQASISGDFLKDSVPLLLPPMAIQERIVAKIEKLFDNLDKGVESLNTAKKQLEQYRQSVLKQAF